MNHSPAGRNIAESRPQAVLFLVIDQYKEIDAVVIKRIGGPHAPKQITNQRFSQVKSHGTASLLSGVFAFVAGPCRRRTRPFPLHCAQPMNLLYVH
jgi:hypothetical protein